MFCAMAIILVRGPIHFRNSKIVHVEQYYEIFGSILQVLPQNSASKMVVDNNIPNFVLLFRNEVYSLTSRLTVSTKAIIRAIDSKVCYF